MLTLWDRSVLMSPNTNDVMYLYFFRALSHIWCRSSMLAIASLTELFYITLNLLIISNQPEEKRMYACVHPFSCRFLGKKNRQICSRLWRVEEWIATWVRDMNHRIIQMEKKNLFFSAFTNDKRHITMTVEYITHKSLMSFIKLWYFIIWHGIHLLRICALGCV